MSMDKIKLKLLKYVKSEGYQESEMQVLLSGKIINHTIVNTLRRVALQEVPTYAFHPSMIKITQNDTVRNNDQLGKDYLCQLCIPNVKHDVIFLPRKYWKDVDYPNVKKEDRYSNDTKNIEIVVNSHNDTSENIYITTHDHIAYYEDGNKILNKFTKSESELIAELRPNESLQFTAKAVIGVNTDTNRGGAIFSAARRVFFERIDDEGKNNISEEDVDYKLIVNSLGQLSELEIMKRSCKIIIKKLDDIKYKINDGLKLLVEKSDRINIRIENENHTLGNLLEYAIQDHPNVVGGAYTKPDHLVDAIHLIFEMEKKNDNPSKIINSIIEYLQKVFKNIEKEFNTFKEIK